MTSHVTIANRALARIGCLPIVSFDIEVERVQNVRRVYDSVVEDIFAKGRWHCGKRTASLTKAGTAPPRYWKNKFVLPPDRVGLPEGYFDSKDCRRPLTLFELAADNEMWTDAEEVYATYPYIPAPVNWPGYLREVVQLGLMAEFAISVREDAALRTRLRRDLYGEEQYQGEGGQFGVAMALEAQAHAQVEIDGGRNPVIDARYQAGDAREGLGILGF
jgi:hypothetical protein